MEYSQWILQGCIDLYNNVMNLTLLVRQLRISLQMFRRMRGEAFCVKSYTPYLVSRGLKYFV